MPIEIKELHIRVSVNTTPNPPLGGQSAAARGAGAGDDGDDAKAAIVDECVEQVLQILRDKTER